MARQKNVDVLFREEVTKHYIGCYIVLNEHPAMLRETMCVFYCPTLTLENIDLKPLVQLRLEEVQSI